MKLCSFILPVFLAISAFGYGQSTNYNLPPGFYLKPNYHVIDFSFKLDGIQLEKEYSEDKIRVLKDISDVELRETSIEYQQYVAEGKAFIESLSAYVKSIYSETEVWYIYAFDSALKSRIQTL